MRKIRCAIYTRKSSEEGLEQEFNSLHAQRDACTAYITSQKHEGWELLPANYDDGGYSGGTMDRPALKALLQDIELGRVDIIVVYKVDRLTRSLADFSKLVDVMDKRGVSFVSITQQFNTTTSMGRLTLNVLLSFAQFEREVTGERIRDKIALSKQRGKWMGGVPPVGYDCKDRKIHVNEEEAKTVRLMFERYSALKSARLLKSELDGFNILTKSRTFSTGRKAGGLPYAEKNLYHLLQNRMYLGEIVHKEKSYPGEHAAIIDKTTFDTVQNIIANNRMKKLGSHDAKYPCLLAGMIYDDCGNIMTPKYSNTRKRFYRYYTSQAIISGYHHKAGSLPNIPAEEVERLVSAEITDFLKDCTRLQPYLRHLDVAYQTSILKKATTVMSGNVDQERLFIRYITHRVEISTQHIHIEICQDHLLEALQDAMHKKRAALPEHPIIINKKIRISATNNGSKVITGSTSSSKNIQLIKAISRSFLWNEQFLSGEKNTIKQIGDENNINSATYVTRIMRLRFLAPSIIESILDGTNPADWTVEKLFAVKTLDWSEQRQLLGVA